MIITSATSKQLIMQELTVPWDERMEEANERKRAKYQVHYRINSAFCLSPSLWPPRMTYELSEILDLRSLTFGRAFPRHGLLLLHWFATEIDIDNHDMIFDPSTNDYSFRVYKNADRIFPALPRDGNSTYYMAGDFRYSDGRQYFQPYVATDE
ncbi:hypothetical protein P4O66_012464, partial [Electrophorus voltai]